MCSSMQKSICSPTILQAFDSTHKQPSPDFIDCHLILSTPTFYRLSFHSSLSCFSFNAALFFFCPHFIILLEQGKVFDHSVLALYQHHNLYSYSVQVEVQRCTWHVKKLHRSMYSVQCTQILPALQVQCVM